MELLFTCNFSNMAISALVEPLARELGFFVATLPDKGHQFEHPDCGLGLHGLKNTNYLGEEGSQL
jgi:hypothetical protein